MLNSAWGWVGWTILAAVPVLIFLLYFLKLRRTRLEVPSTFLWQRSIEDLQVNSLWQRLRSSLLLWLQLAIALLLLLSLLPLGCDAVSQVGQRHIFLLDTSSSMTATDVDGNRFEWAKAQIEEKLGALPEVDLAMLMTSDDQAQIRQPYTTDRALLLRKLQEIQLRPRLTLMDDALIAATGLANPSHVRDAGDQLTSEQVAEEIQKSSATLHWYSDGGFPPIKEAALGELSVDYIPVGSPNISNLGITAFSAQWNEKKKGFIDLYARLENFSSAPMTAELELKRGGEVIDVIRRTDIPPGEVVSLEFQDAVAEQATAVTEYELKISSDDDLIADNTAFCVVNPGRRPRVLLVTPGNPSLEAALSTTLIAEGLELEIHNPEFLETSAYKLLTDTPLCDLIVFDRVAPKEMPASNTMFWAAAPQSDWTVTPIEPPVFVLYSNNTHPVTLSLNLDTLAFLQAGKISGPPASIELLTSNEGPLMMIGPRGAYQDLVIGFGLFQAEETQVLPNTDWPGRISFPVFIYNTLEFLGRLGQKEIESSLRPGQSVRFRLESEDEKLTVVSPDGTKQTLSRLSDGGFVFNGTDQLGLYRVLGDGDQPLRSFAVSLSDRRESDINVNPELMVGYTPVTASSPENVSQQQTWWRSILVIALLLIMAEWLVYNRRLLL